MAYRVCKLGLLVRLQPEEAARQILAGFRSSDGKATVAAARLGVDRSTLNRWITALEIRSEVEQIRESQRVSSELAVMPQVA